MWLCSSRLGYGQEINNILTDEEEQQLKQGISMIDTSCAEGATSEYDKWGRESCCKKEHSGFLDYCVGKIITYRNNKPYFISLNEKKGLTFSYELIPGTLKPISVSVYRDSYLLFEVEYVNGRCWLKMRIVRDSIQEVYNYYYGTSNIESFGHYTFHKVEAQKCMVGNNELPKTGEWFYFDKSGFVIRREYWNKGTLIKVEIPQ